MLEPNGFETNDMTLSDDRDKKKIRRLPSVVLYIPHLLRSVLARPPPLISVLAEIVLFLCALRDASLLTTSSMFIFSLFPRVYLPFAF